MGSSGLSFGVVLEFGGAGRGGGRLDDRQDSRAFEGERAYIPSYGRWVAFVVVVVVVAINRSIPGRRRIISSMLRSILIAATH